jgi:hypothetical protein
VGKYRGSGTGAQRNRWGYGSGTAPLGRGGYHLQDMDHCGASFESPMLEKIIEHLFLFYGSITAVYLEHNFDNMHNAWDPQQHGETLFKKIQDCVD